MFSIVRIQHLIVLYAKEIDDDFSQPPELMLP